MRIDKLLAHTGYGTRKEVKKLVKQGAVEADGIKIKSFSAQVNPDKEVITVKGETVEYREFIYLMMNKPPGVISATEDDMHETVVNILELEDIVRQPFPVGRLDKDTEGLLILTNDGKFAHGITSPKKHVSKVYEAVLDQTVTEEDKKRFAEGIVLDDGYETKPARLEQIDSEKMLVHITISEGKFHQVKRMCHAVGKEVLFLKRIQIGGIVLDPKLETGEYRDLRDEEIEELQNS
ncbi:pseudouridine synthase [Sinobaca sp. H24]|uniref:pseudouridine synthase n=1 Tax=Sinobaca sp. H24 TaxID=2923376 RepID=UPI00207A81B4|nr:pseudouridine synthase [Sinobaca sp. H24]